MTTSGIDEKSPEQIESEQALQSAIEAVEPAGDVQGSAYMHPAALPAAESGRINAAEAVAAVFDVSGMALALAGYTNTAAALESDKTADLSNKLVAVLEKYETGRKILGWIQSAAGAIGAEEFALFLAIKPLAVAVAAGFKQDLAELEAKRKPAEKEVQNVQPQNA